MASRYKHFEGPIDPAGVPRSRETQQVGQILQELLEVLAPLLLANGITPTRIADIAKNALVASAASSARMSTGRVNQSKVAAITGLSRAEIRGRLAGASRLPPTRPKALDRSARVLAGWLRDPLFIDESGKPRSLPLKTGRWSFSELVRLHSGDVPPRVVLEQLHVRGLVRIGTDSVTLKVRPRLFRGTRGNALADVAPYVRDLLATAATDAARLAYAHKVNIVVETSTQEILLTERVVRALATTAALLSSVAEAASVPKNAQVAKMLAIALTLTTTPIANAGLESPIAARRKLRKSGIHDKARIE